MTEEKANIDRLNRTIEQEAETDADLETIVPPTWGPASYWRIGLVVLLVLIIAVVVYRGIA